MELAFLDQIRSSEVDDATLSANTMDWYCCDAVPLDVDAGDVGVDDGDDVVEILDDVDVAHESDGDVATAVTFHRLNNGRIVLHRLTVALPSGQHWMPTLSPLSMLIA